jgi:hypothetical protein
MSDALFSEASWFFFAFWSMGVAAVSFAAFRSDPVPVKVRGSSLSPNSSATSISALDPSAN